MSSTPRGALIVIEGLDRAGKSTQCERLHQYLEVQNGRRVKRMKFPDRTTPIGKSINAYLRGELQQEDHVIHLLFSANRWEAAAQIRADVENGITVLVDRYYYSGVVYSAAKGREDLSLRWAREPEVGLPQPDLCIFLDISSEAAARRGGYGEEKYENGEMQEKVRRGFGMLMRSLDGRDIRAVDASRSEDEVGRDIQALVDQVLQGGGMRRPLRTVLRWEELSSNAA